MVKFKINEPGCAVLLQASRLKLSGSMDPLSFLSVRPSFLLDEN